MSAGTHTFTINSPLNSVGMARFFETGSGGAAGFTKDGDVVANDPATRFDRGEIVRRIYKRENVIQAWMKSHNAVYLVYPEKARVPKAKLPHWDSRGARKYFQAEVRR